MNTLIILFGLALVLVFLRKKFAQFQKLKRERTEYQLVQTKRLQRKLEAIAPKK